VIVDTVGNVLDVVVHAANIQDRDGARLLLKRLWEQTRDHVQKIWTDGAYKGDLVDWVQEGLDAGLDTVEREVEREEDQDGFEVLPRRWGWSAPSPGWAGIGGSAKITSDMRAAAEGMIYLASIQTMAKRIAANS
jgi:putative transposase